MPILKKRDMLKGRRCITMSWEVSCLNSREVIEETKKLQKNGDILMWKVYSLS
jgi:hypothetical protein